jgi:hypothetical protein
MDVYSNTIAPWQMSVRHTLRNLQRCGAFIAAFTSEKHWMIIKKSWQLIPYIFSIYLLILLLCKIKGTVGAVCALLRN